MVFVTRYTAADAALWDVFVRGSRNGTFLLERSYMDYHSDRFRDHSLMYRDDRGRLLAVMAANEAGDTLHSHQGLTYGGLVLAPGVHASDVGAMFDLTVEYLRDHGFKAWVYKPVPAVYHKIPSDEDVYFLWRHGARMTACNLSSVIDYGSVDGLRAEYCRRNALSRLSAKGVRLDREARVQDFWPLLTEHLADKYGASPVHTLQEMERLQGAFPQNISCAAAVDDGGTMLAAVVMYVAGQVAHVQYSASTERGRRMGAQDFLYLSLVNHYGAVPGIRFFDFGTSNEEGGRVLNATLNRYKEGFGARGVTYKQFCLVV